MNILHPQLMIPVVIFFLGFIFFFLRYRRLFFKWVRKCWYLKPTNFFKISHFLYLLAIALFLLSALDWRGRPTRLQGEVSKQKTLILIDASASMLTEDVRPNRFKKAIFLARHFVKNAAGHSLAVHLFSDINKKLVPFTTDVDLIDARLSGLEDLQRLQGGTALSLAVSESMQYFQTAKGVSPGNLLILTDSEETEDYGEIKVPKEISVAVVGIGTRKGGQIPMRDTRSQLRGYKKFEGQAVISKLDEDFLKRLGEKIDDYKYWVASSYVLPTDDILAFFNRSLQKRRQKEDVIIRPVLVQWFLIPAFLCLILASFLGKGRSFAVLSLMVFFGSLAEVSAQNAEQDVDKLRQGDLNALEKANLAQKFLQNEKPQEAQILYEEGLPYLPDVAAEERVNYGTSLLQQGKIKEGLDIYKDIESELLEKNAESSTLKTIRKNRLFALRQQQKQQEQDQKEKESEQKESEDEKEGDQQKQQKGNDSKKSDGKEKQSRDGEQKENDKKKSDQGPQKKSQQKGPQGKMKKKKIPSLVKQLLNDDRKLQEKLLDTSTNKPINGPKKDW